MSSKIELSKRDTKSLVKRYEKDRESLAELAEATGYAISTVRRILVDAGVTIRRRGRQAGK